MSQDSQIVQKIKQLQQRIIAKSQSDTKFQESANKLIKACASLTSNIKSSLQTIISKSRNVESLQRQVRDLSQRLQKEGDVRNSDLQALGQLDEGLANLNNALKSQDLESELTALNNSLQELYTLLGNSTAPSSSTPSMGAVGGSRKKRHNKKGGYTYKKKKMSIKSKTRTRSKTKTRSKRR